MRTCLVAAAALSAFLMLLTVQTTGANAVVCARGVVRAGCGAAGGTAVVHTAPVCRYSSSTAYAFAAAPDPAHFSDTIRAPATGL
jgi:hypothetical protein